MVAPLPKKALQLEPQGSVIAPTLFLVFIDDIVNEVSNHLEMFADDTTLHCVIDSPEDREAAAKSLQADLDKIEAWARAWIVTYNATKTEVLTISRKKDVTQLPPSRWQPPYVRDLLLHPPLIFFGKRLKEASCVKLLGVTLTETLDWGKHINTVAAGASKSIGILHRAKRYTGSSSLAILYKAFVRSKMEYCSPLWIGGSGLGRLDNLQRRCCRLMGFRHQSTVPALNIQSLEHRRIVSGLCLYYRMWSKIAPPDVCSLLPPLANSDRPNANRKNLVPARHVSTSTTNYHQMSFIPHFTRIWNLLPQNCLSPPAGSDAESDTGLQTFKKSVNRIDLENFPVHKLQTHSR